MGFFKRQQQATANVHFVDRNSEARKSKQWTSDDTVQGIAHFQLPRGTQFTRAMVILKGVVTTKTNESSPGSLQPTWRVERMKFLSVGKESQLRSRPVPEDGVVEMPFRFDLRECLRYSMLDSGLPPSLDSRNEGHNHKAFHMQDSKASYDITYTITASALSSRGTIASKMEKISILPVGQPEPPSYGSLEVDGEYFTAKASTRGSRIPLSTRRESYQVEAAGQEPSPLVLQPQDAKGDPSTNVSLLIKLSSEKGSDSISSPPQQVQIRTQLVSKTEISPDGARSRRAREQDSQTRFGKSNAHDYTLAIPNWETFQSDGDIPGFTIARLSFLYRHPEAERLWPTFSSPILSRSYALEVKVSFPEDGAQSSKLSLPLRVMYESPSVERSGTTDDVGLERKITQCPVYEVEPTAS